MGDRANIRIQQEFTSADIYLYTHWGGEGLPKKLQDALARGRGRWTDPAYLTRIIFCEMVRGYELDETGFGISTQILDNEHPVLRISWRKNTGYVTLFTKDNKSTKQKGWSFDEYVALESFPWWK